MAGHFRRTMALAATLGVLATPARASDSFQIPERFQLTVSGAFTSLDTQASLGPAGGGVGASLVLEDLFDIPVHKSFVDIDGTWKYWGRHHVDVGYVNVERTGKSVVDNEFSFGDYTFQAGATTEAFFGSRFAYAAYRLDLVQAKPVVISASLGVSATRLALRVTGQGGVVDTAGQAVTGTASMEGKVPLPVPLLGLQVDWRINERSELQSYQRVVGIDAKSIRGGMTQWKIRYHYYLTPNFGLGVGYEAVNVSMPKFETEDRAIRFNYALRGFTLGAQAAF